MKKLLAALGGVALLLLLPVALSSKMHVVRSIEIQGSPGAIHSYLADLNQYPKWNPFSENDPGATNQITGTGVGSVLTWKGEKTGEGRMTITRIRPNERIELELEFFTPMAGLATIGWETISAGTGKTRMTWSMDEKLPYFQKYFGLFMKGMIGKTFDRGLANLKRQIEKS